MASAPQYVSLLKLGVIKTEPVRVNVDKLPKSHRDMLDVLGGTKATKLVIGSYNLCWAWAIDCGGALGDRDVSACDMDRLAALARTDAEVGDQNWGVTVLDADGSTHFRNRSTCSK